MTVPTLTSYNPQGMATAGMSTIGVTPAIANIEAPTLAELNGGIVFQCATEAFGLGISAGTVSRKKLCDVVAKKRRGETEYDDITLTFTLDAPQGAEQKLLDAFEMGATVFLYHRPGMTHTEPFAAAQKVMVIEAIVNTRTLAEITTENGEEYQATVTLMPQSATDLFGTVAA